MTNCFIRRLAIDNHLSVIDIRLQIEMTMLHSGETMWPENPSRLAGWHYGMAPQKTNYISDIVGVGGEKRGLGLWSGSWHCVSLWCLSADSEDTWYTDWPFAPAVICHVCDVNITPSMTTDHLQSAGCHMASDRCWNHIFKAHWAFRESAI